MPIDTIIDDGQNPQRTDLQKLEGRLSTIPGMPEMLEEESRKLEREETFASIQQHIDETRELGKWDTTCASVAEEMQASLDVARARHASGEAVT